MCLPEWVLMAWVEIPSESVTCGFKNCPVGADLVNARVVLWKTEFDGSEGVQRASGARETLMLEVNSWSKFVS